MGLPGRTGAHPPAAERAGARPPSSAAPVHGIHASDIAQLALTLDGGAAVTADARGALRLWPTLDGRVEPVVVRAPAARAVAVLRADAGFAIGVIDSAGELTVIRLDAVGGIVGQVAVPASSQAVSLTATASGLLVLRADQQLEDVRADGGVASRLTAEPGTRIEHVVARGDHALALIGDGSHLRGRRLVLAPAARWGDTTPAFTADVARAMISPDGKTLAIERRAKRSPQLIDLDTGKARRGTVCVDATNLADEERPNAGASSVPVGFLADAVFVCRSDGELAWWSIAAQPPQIMTRVPVALSVQPAQVAGSVAVVGAGASLAIARSEQTVYLGYAQPVVSHLLAGPAGVIAVAGGRAGFVLDETLRERAGFPFAELVQRGEAVVLDERHIAFPRRVERDRLDLWIGDTVTGMERHQVRLATATGTLSYEPSTRLLVVQGPGAPIVLRYDPVRRALGEPRALPPGLVQPQVLLVDPALARGAAALLISKSSHGLVVSERTAEGLLGADDRPGASYEVAGDLRAFDRAGRLYLRVGAESRDVTVYTRGAVSAKLAGVARLALAPSRDGSLIVAYDAARTSLLDERGAVRWQTSHWRNRTLVWTDAGALVASFDGGLARVDLATGELTTRTCGWAFGVSSDRTTMAQPIGVDEASVCER